MSNVSVSMKMSPKQAGALYMKSIRQEERIAELEHDNALLKNSPAVKTLSEAYKRISTGREMRDLEQQIKALHWVKINASYNTNGNRMICIEDVEGRINTLDKKAARLKEQGE